MAELSRQSENSAVEETMLESFGRSFAWSLAQGPSLGLMQLVDKTSEKVAEMTGYQNLATNLLPTVRFMDPPKTHEFLSANWLGEQTGGVAGAIPWLLLIHRGVSKRSMIGASSFKGGSPVARIFGQMRSLGAAETLNSGITGAIYGGALQPIGEEAPNFWQARYNNAIIDGGTFAAMAMAKTGMNMARGVNPSSSFGQQKILDALYSNYPQPLRPLPIVWDKGLNSHLMEKAMESVPFVGTMSGMAGGFFNAEARSLLTNGRLAYNWSELKEPLLTYGMYGGALGVMRAASGAKEGGGPRARTYSGEPKSLPFHEGKPVSQSTFDSARPVESGGPRARSYSGEPKSLPFHEGKPVSQSSFDSARPIDSGGWPTRSYSGEPKTFSVHEGVPTFQSAFEAARTIENGVPRARSYSGEPKTLSFHEGVPASQSAFDAARTRESSGWRARNYNGEPKTSWYVHGANR